MLSHMTLRDLSEDHEQARDVLHREAQDEINLPHISITMTMLPMRLNDLKVLDQTDRLIDRTALTAIDPTKAMD